MQLRKVFVKASTRPPPTCQTMNFGKSGLKRNAIIKEYMQKAENARRSGNLSEAELHEARARDKFDILKAKGPSKAEQVKEAARVRQIQAPLITLGEQSQVGNPFWDSPRGAA